MCVNWLKIAGSIAELSFNAKSLVEVTAGGKSFCIGKFKDKLFAFAQKCPHAGGLLVEGWIDATGNVVCPLHHYKFCMANGRNVSGEGYQLKQWPIEERNDGVWVQFKEPGLLEMLGERH